MTQTQICEPTLSQPSLDVTVNVVATLHEDDGVEFQCSWKGDDGAWHSGPITFPYGSSNNKLTFDLDDKTKLNLRFEANAADAVWLNEGCCPTNGNGDDLGQITDRDVDRGSKKKLTFKNLNTEECTLHYALRFTGDSWTNAAGKTFSPPYVKDPELRNSGGGGNFV